MSGTEAVIYVLCISLVIAVITGFMVRRKGYSFLHYFVTGFIASCGVLGIAFKIISDYL